MTGRLKYFTGFTLLLLGITLAMLSCETAGSVDPVYKDYFIKYYGGDGNQVARDFVVNADGTIVIVGTSIEANGDTSRVYLVKVNAEGNVIWEKKLGTGRESARDIDVFKAGPYVNHFMILSNCKRFDSDSTDVKVFVVDELGVVVDSTVFSPVSTAYGYVMPAFGNSLTALTDGGYVITGNIDSAANPGDGPDKTYEDVKDILSVRYNQSLSLLNPTWKTSFSGEAYAMGVKIFENGSQFLFAGYSDRKQANDDGIPDKNMVFMKLSSTGDEYQTKYSGELGAVNETMSGITKSLNGFYIAIGTQIDVNDHSVYACIIDGSFSNVIKEGVVSNAPDQADGVAVAESQSGNGFWVLANESRTGGRNIWVGKINDDLEAEVSFSFGGSNNDDTASAIKELSTGDLLILGTMQLVNQTKMALIKVRPNGSFK